MNAGSDGKEGVLCQGRGEERGVDQQGGRDLDRLRQGPPWRRKVEGRAAARRPAEVRQELPAPVAKLPPARHQAWQHLQRGGGPHHPSAQAPGQQVISSSVRVRANMLVHESCLVITLVYLM
jgi:hypothetical protein